MKNLIEVEYQNNKFIKSILEGIHDWVRVIDRDDNVLFVNSSMAKEKKDVQIGEKCYQLIGRKSPCENCISRKSSFEGNVNQKEEIINDRIFQVISSPIIEDDGSINAVVEVLRDITESKIMQHKILEQNNILTNDIAMAKKLEFSLLPSGFSHEIIKFAYKYLPSEEIGGDFLSIFNIDDNHVGVYIADVSGHGLPASLLTVFVNSGLSKRILSPAKALDELFKRYNDAKISTDLYITVFYAIINTENRTITYSNAGHGVSPILANGNRFEMLASKGIPISNWVEEPNYKDTTIDMNRGDKILFSTDGLIELLNSENKQFGDDQLIEVLTNNNGSPDEIIEEIFVLARKFMNVNLITEMNDDITVAVLSIG